MKLKIQYTKDDLLEYQQAIQIRLRKLPSKGGIDFILNFALWILIALVILTTFSIYRDNPEIRPGIIYVVVYLAAICAILVGMGIFNRRRFNSRILAQDGVFLCPKEIEIFDDRIVFYSKYGQQSYLLCECLDLIKIKRNFFIFIDNAQAIVLPENLVDQKMLEGKIGARP